MAAVLNKQQFMSVEKVGHLISDDWDVPMSHVHAHPTLGGEGRLQGDDPHASGGNRPYSMTAMTRDVKAHGVREELTINHSPSGTVRVREGHHRYVAARDAGLTKVPVIHQWEDQRGYIYDHPVGQ
jgi:ParB-like nuclease domain